ncbi:hypothetical protein [Marinirhabdus gelatinilytica]|uniref:Uncharacterized protein n=1 Tax=Marinirhabdus gelatinilytica TaxID=1703343 RepID=A0A370QGD2_9FLAO|nr:hypothetical protein [Marinirhabdus gelatinilytica]RDK87349.1 hypothetical protein C8D94_102536 [Marinirhabdus gelatinilytica]
MESLKTLVKKNIQALILFGVVTLGYAQNDIQVITQVLPPYSPYFSDYVSYENRLVIQFNNTTSVPKEIRLTATIIGDNGVSMVLAPSFVPPSPILVPPLGMTRLTGIQLQDYWNINAWQVSGVTASEIIIGNGLPEGNYELCIRALDFATGQPLSLPAPSGCSFFNINSIEPPIILQPMCGEIVNTGAPQNLLFSWSIPAGANPSQIEYELVIMEVFNNMDPNQLFLSSGTPPFFQKIIPVNVYNYTLADPPLEKGRTYAFRVTALNKPGNPRPLNFRNGGSSEVCTFIYGEPEDTNNDVITIGQNTEQVTTVTIPIDEDQVLDNNQGQQGDPDPNDSPDCIATCTVNVPQNTTLLSNISPGETVSIGKFSMEVVQAQFSGNGFTGTGVVYTAFLEIPILVEFSNLKINTEKQVFDGKATATLDGGMPNNLDFITNPVDVPQITEGVFSSVQDFIEDEGRKIHLLKNETDGVGVPLSWEVNNNALTLLGIIFTPTQAHINLAAGFELFEANEPDQFLILTGSNCFRPNGFGENGQLNLLNTVTIPITEQLDQVFEPGTYVDYNCNGIGLIHLNGSLQFDRDLALPLDAEGNVIEGKLEAAYETDISNFNDWTLQLESFNHPFTIPGLVGFKMDATSIILDHSTASTPAQADKPNNWQGCFIENISVRFPEFFQINNQVIEKQIENFIVDKNGVSGTIGPFNNLIDISEGDVSGWPISVDQFSVVLENSNLDGVDINGGLKLPIADTELGYDLLLTSGENAEDPINFEFNVNTEEDLEVPMWFATLDLLEGSTVTITKYDNNWEPRAELHGSISLGWQENGPESDNMVSSIFLPSVTFENLTIEPGPNNIPDVNIGAFGITEAQATIADFSFGLNELSFQKDPNTNELGITIDMFVHLFSEGNSIGGSTAFTIWGALENNSYTYKRTQFNSISINGLDIGVATIDGDLFIYQKDEVYGNGFKGAFDIVLNPVEMSFAALMQFGSIKNEEEDYRYFYTDSYAKIDGSGIPIPPTPFAIFGGSGGFWVNMETPNLIPEANPKTLDELQLENELTDEDAQNMQPGTTRFEEDIKIPKKETAGFSQSIIIGINSAETLFNADLGFGMEIGVDGSFNGAIWMDGNGYLVQEMEADRADAFIKGDVNLTLQYDGNAEDNANLKVSNTSTLTIDILDGLVTGEGTLAIYADKNKWYHKLGYWTNEDYPWQDPTRATLSLGDFKGLGTDAGDGPLDASIHSYFMMGNDIPGVPKLPLDIRNHNDGPTLMPDERSSVFTAEGETPGLALGGGMHIAADMDFLIFYLRSKFITGFDFALREDTGLCAGNFGLNGMYAKGQAYGYFSGDAGVKLDLWVWKGEASLMQVDAVATLEAGLPNPEYLKGNVAVEGDVLDGLLVFNIDFNVALGEECNAPSSGPFDEYPIIAEVIPEDQAEKVEIFTIPEVSFNFPDGPFEYTEMNKNGKEVTRTFQYDLDYFTLEWIDAETNNPRSKDFFPVYRPDGYSATFTDLEFILPEETLITYSIGVTGNEIVDGNKEERTKETKIGSFTTDKLPSRIKEKHIWNSTPFLGENYFIPSNEPLGSITLPLAFSHWDDPQYWYVEAFELDDNYAGALADGTFDFIARFIDVKSKQTFESAYQVDNSNAQGVFGGQLTFPIPQGLDKEQIYELQLLVKFTPALNNVAMATNTQAVYQEVLLGASGQGGNNGGGGMNAGQGFKNLQGNLNFQSQNGMGIGNQVANTPPEPNLVFQGSLANANTGNQNVSIKRQHRKLLGATKTKNVIEWSLFDGFKFYFKTSKYGTLQTKLNTLIYEDTQLKNYQTDHFGIGTDTPEIITTQVPIAILKSGENFDEQVIFPKKKSILGHINGEKKTLTFSKKPLLEFKDQPFSTQWGTYGNTHFWGISPNDLKITYHVPNSNDWAQLEKEGVPYQNLDYTYPSPDYWSLILPEMQANNPWQSNRYLDNNRFQPFNDRHYPNVFEAIEGTPQVPTIHFYAHDYAIHGSLYHDGKPIGFNTKKLNYPPNGNNNGGGGMWGGNNQYQNPNPPSTEAYFGVIDYTEWLTMRDWYTLRKHINEANENIDQDDVAANYDYDTFIKVKDGIRNWIQNKHPYWPFRRSGCSLEFTLQKTGVSGIKRKVGYNVPPDLNIDN